MGLPEWYPQWQAIRKQVLRRARGICEQCGERKAQHVHHLSYANPRGQEDLRDLLAVCLKCHGEFHPHHTFRPIWEQKKPLRRKPRGERVSLKEQSQRALKKVAERLDPKRKAKPQRDPFGDLSRRKGRRN